MTAREYLEELAYPVASTTTLVALLTFVLLISLAQIAGLLGIWLMVVTVPAFLRYLTMIAEARGRGRETAPPGIEYFTLVGNAWTLFSVVPVVLMAMLVREAAQSFGDLAALLLALAFAALLPAVIGVLVITHSPLQGIDPRRVAAFISRCGSGYWFAPSTAVLIVVVPMLLGSLPGWATIVVEVYLLAAFFAVIGAVTRRADLFDEIDMPEDAEPEIEKVVQDLERERIAVLNHAYGFVSRGNRDGGLGHVYDRLVVDPDPESAWPWFFEQMLRWEDTYPGLLLAQQYLGRLLAHNDKLAAVKLMLRCRMINDSFRPLTRELSAAIDAARSCGNDELAEALRR